MPSRDTGRDPTPRAHPSPLGRRFAISRRRMLAAAGCLLAFGSPAGGQPPADVFLWTFDQNPLGEPPLEWESQAGRWLVRPEGEGLANRVLVHAGPSVPGLDLPVILAPIASAHDLKASVRFKRTGSGASETAALVLRWHDAASMILATVEASAGRIWMEQLRGGSRRLLFGTSMRIPPGGWHRLEASALGERIAVSLDGRHLGTARDPDPAPGRVGLAARPGAGILLDDLEVVPR